MKLPSQVHWCLHYSFCLLPSIHERKWKPYTSHPETSFQHVFIAPSRSSCTIGTQGVVAARNHIWSPLISFLVSNSLGSESCSGRARAAPKPFLSAASSPGEEPWKASPMNRLLFMAVSPFGAIQDKDLMSSGVCSHLPRVCFTFVAVCWQRR